MYLLACTVVMVLAIVQCVRAFIRDIIADNASTPMKYLHGPMWLSVTPAFLMLAPFLESIFDEMSLQHGIPVAISSGRFSAWLALLGALIVLAATVADGIRHRTERDSGFSIRRLVLAASASLVLVAATSHLMFARDAGTVLFDAFREEVNDMHCEASRILIRWDHSPDSPVRYRCPRGYMLNRHASMSFMPWPDYSEGYSADLAVALHDMLRNAQEP